MQSSENITNLIKALSEAQGEFKSLVLDKTNPHFKSRYASLESMKNATMPALRKHGLTLNFFPATIEGVNYMEAMLMHTSGEYILTRYIVCPEKNTMQGMGSAWTYLKRYIWGSVFSLYDDTNDDEEGESLAEKKSPPSKTISARELGELEGKIGNNPTLLSSVLKFCKIQELREMEVAQFPQVIARLNKG